MKKIFGGGNRGFALLFAVLTASILLSIGVSIFSLTVKELGLSSSGRESAYAFYAADSGAECAYYWDTSGPIQPSPFIEGSGTISCGGSSINLSSSTNGGTATSTSFDMNVDTANGYCAVVNISKTDTGTVIQSRGYNICAGSPLAPSYGNQNLVERGLSITY